MVQNIVGTNTLYYEFNCPICDSVVRSGVGFRVGIIKHLTYRLGQKLDWGNVQNSRPPVRPENGNLKTIGYFNCDNPRCQTWSDCFPEVQEAIIIIKNDIIEDVQPTGQIPENHTFDILEPEELRGY